MDGELHFLVQGSTAAPFNVRFRRSGNHLYATCTCNAGLLGKLCKHRLGLMKGDPTGILGGNADQVHGILDLFKGTSGEGAAQELLEAEGHLNKAQALFTAKKEAFLALVRT